MNDDQQRLLTFPCQFPIKAMGLNHDSFESSVLSIINQHVPSLSEGAIATRTSKDAKYLSLTITITATSQIQLDNIYHALSSHPEVLYVL